MVGRPAVRAQVLVCHRLRFRRVAVDARPLTAGDVHGALQLRIEGRRHKQIELLDAGELLQRSRNGQRFHALQDGGQGAIDLARVLPPEDVIGGHCAQRVGGVRGRDVGGHLEGGGEARGELGVQRRLFVAAEGQQIEADNRNHAPLGKTLEEHVPQLGIGVVEQRVARCHVEVRVCHRLRHVSPRALSEWGRGLVSARGEPSPEVDGPVFCFHGDLSRSGHGAPTTGSIQTGTVRNLLVVLPEFFLSVITRRVAIQNTVWVPKMEAGASSFRLESD